MSNLKISVLGSGSRGNATALWTNDEGILIDVGFSRRELYARMEKVGMSRRLVKAVLISHEHDDHVKGMRVLTNDLEINSYISKDTYEYLKAYKKTGEKNQLFLPGEEFHIGKFKINPFSLPHDAVEPSGFTVHFENIKIGFATDLGHLTNLAKNRLRDCDVLIIESNHDPEMLMASQRPLHLKRRILGKHGHLSNSDCLDALDELFTKKTRYLFLVHISKECNSHELVEKLTREKLAELGRQDILLHVTEQSEVSTPVSLT